MSSTVADQTTTPLSASLEDYENVPELPKGHDFTLTTSDDIDLSVTRWQPEGEPIARVVVAHGFSAHRDSPETKHLITALLKNGADLTVHDARGHGESSGSSTAGDSERHDVDAVINYVANDPTNSHLPLVLIGVSMGAIASSNYLSSFPENPIDALVLISSPAFWRVRVGQPAIAVFFLFRTRFGRKFAARYLKIRIAKGVKRPLAPARILPELKVPVGIIGYAPDLLFGKKAARKLHKAANNPKRLTYVEEGGHGTGPAAIQACLDLYHWLLEYIKDPAAAEAEANQNPDPAQPDAS